MNKKKDKKDKDEKAEPPIDYQVEKKNLEYTITLKYNENEMLKEENAKKKKYIFSLEDELSKMKMEFVSRFEVEKKLRIAEYERDQKEEEIKKLNNDIIEMKKEFDEEKRQIEKSFNARINHLQNTIDSYEQKLEIAQKAITKNEELTKEVKELREKIIKMVNEHKVELEKLEISYQLKHEKLRQKMMENIQKTQDKVKELNVEYMDISTKLTLLQNEQLLLQLDYETHQIDELNKKKEELEKKVSELKKDIEIHKEVELSLANKNKSLKEELLKYYSNEEEKNGDEKNKDKNIDKNKDNNEKLNINKNYNNNNQITEDKKESMGVGGCPLFPPSFFVGSSPSEKFIKNYNLEQKVIVLEKKLNQKRKEYNSLKDKYEFIETVQKNQEKKYSNLYKFLDENLNEFFNDTELRANEEIYVNIDSIKNCDFSCLNKEEKYSALILLMKHLFPLINQKLSHFPMQRVENIKLRYNNFSKNSFINSPIKFKKIGVNKLNYHHLSCENIINNQKQISERYSCDSLPSIIRQRGPSAISKISKVSSSHSNINSASTNHN